MKANLRAQDRAKRAMRCRYDCIHTGTLLRVDFEGETLYAHQECIVAAARKITEVRRQEHEPLLAKVPIGALVRMVVTAQRDRE